MYSRESSTSQPARPRPQAGRRRLVGGGGPRQPVAMPPGDDVLRGHIRNPAYVRVSHGLFEKRAPSGVPEPAELRRLATWLAVLPPDARFTHVTGAALRGWQLPRLPEPIPVFAATNDEDRPRRLGLQVSRLTHRTQPELRLGLPVESGPEILLRAARDLSFLDLVALVDSARLRHDVDGITMKPILVGSRPGVRALRDAWEFSTGKCESAWESYLYTFHRSIGVDVEPQVDILGPTGRFVGRADLVIVGTYDVQEYDGGAHRDRAVHRRDLRRERGFAGTPYTRRGYTSEDLLVHDLEMLLEIDGMLERVHVPARLTRWRALVTASCLSRSGRDRLTNRWLGRPPRR